MKWPLQPGDLDTLAHEALVREFEAVAIDAGHAWVKDFVYPDWIMRKFIAERGTWLPGTASE